MTNTEPKRVRVIDSHTGGEPTRVVISGGPELGEGPLSERLERMKTEHDDFRTAVVCEPRGSEPMVGALLCKPVDRLSTAGVIFFDKAGYLGMCGHGTIGLMTTLAFLKMIKPGAYFIETPVGMVRALLHDSGEVTVKNVESYRTQANVAIKVPGYGKVKGDVAWGGNWFFLINDHRLELSPGNIEALTHYACQVREALTREGITGDSGQEIDHIELFGPSRIEGVDSKNFVLVPGKTYDRSPCGTGTSAKMACLYRDGKLKEDQVWRQESIIGSVFEGGICIIEDKIYPHIKGSAFVNAEADLIFNENDPFCMGIRK
ncbi:MAG: proline racemase family protein [Blastocatellia bacterium]|nr:proline racemase family protein [Blastocatellia bacterium]